MPISHSQQSATSPTNLRTQLVSRQAESVTLDASLSARSTSQDAEQADDYSPVQVQDDRWHLDDDDNTPQPTNETQGQAIISNNEFAAATSHPPSSTAISLPSTHDERLVTRQSGPYSKGGFDVMKAFHLIAGRQEPTVQLGPVDMSCSFVVCDALLADHPIVYASSGFYQLTGYRQYEALGRNGRFLQAPDGQLEAGSRRQFVNNTALFAMKQHVDNKREIQQHVLNYRKGGVPFVNMLSLIPIPWDTDHVRYIVGFQAEATGVPRAFPARSFLDSVLAHIRWRNLTPTTPGRTLLESNETRNEDYSLAGQQQGNRDFNLALRWDEGYWKDEAARNVDDVLQVLTLSGHFLYVSPSCKRILGYDSSDLIGKSLASICHPADIIPAQRELRNTALHSSVNMMFRVQNERGRYVWFESVGSRLAGRASRQDCIVIASRPKPVFSLSRAAVEAHGGFNEGDVWCKMSTSGLILFMSTTASSLLGLTPEQLIGTKIQDISSDGSRLDLEFFINTASTGQVSASQHDIRTHHAQPRAIRAQITIYPGDAAEARVSKPAFLLAQIHAITRSSRSLAAGQAVAAAVPTAQQSLALVQDVPDNVFHELAATGSTSWQFEVGQLARTNRGLASELEMLLARQRRRRRTSRSGNLARGCANCHTRDTPEWRKGPSGNRDLCNRCGLRWAKQR